MKRQTKQDILDNIINADWEKANKQIEKISKLELLELITFISEINGSLPQAIEEVTYALSQTGIKSHAQ